MQTPVFNRKRAVAGLLLAAILIVLVGARAAHHAAGLLDALLAVNHTQRLITNIYETDSLLDNADAAVRHYLLSPQDRYLADYRTAEKEVPLHMAEFEKLLSDAPYPLPLVSSYRFLILQQMAHFQELVEHQQRHIKSIDHAQSLNDQINEKKTALLLIAQSVLRDREHEEKEEIRHTLIVSLLGGILCLLLLLGVYRYVFKKPPE